MKKIRIFLFFVAALFLLSMAPSPSHVPAEGSLDPGLHIKGNISSDNQRIRFVVWNSYDLKPYSGYEIKLVSTANTSDTVVIVPAAGSNGGTDYAITEADKASDAKISFVITDESGKIVSRGKAACSGGLLSSMSFDLEKVKTNKRR